MTCPPNARGRDLREDREVSRGSAPALRAAKTEAGDRAREARVVVRAGARTPYQAVITAQEALGQLGYRQILLAVATPTEKKASSK